ncbi:uncharacterized protein LOC128208927 [Mya arenaria]|uniref:uncharacterized protein LOC128208927 n=1 Tax=Mya arenaria TaxID=6604 RepID=UPI0022E0880F|nr:uncharacterized protein LOC128208927 [Mya arenaria]
MEHAPFDPFTRFFEIPSQTAALPNEESTRPSSLEPPSAARPIFGRNHTFSSSAEGDAFRSNIQRLQAISSNNEPEQSDPAPSSTSQLLSSPLASRSLGEDSFLQLNVGRRPSLENDQIDLLNINQSSYGGEIRPPIGSGRRRQNSNELSSTGFFDYIGSNTENDSGNDEASSSISGSPPQELVVLNRYPQYSVPPLNPDVLLYNRVAIIMQDIMNRGNNESSVWNRRTLEEGRFCAFCKNNKERHEFYTTHVVKDNWGKVICPILRKYRCPTCGATGDNAHTIRHCPVRARLDLQ